MKLQLNNVVIVERELDKPVEVQGTPARIGDITLREERRICRKHHRAFLKIYPGHAIGERYCKENCCLWEKCWVLPSKFTGLEKKYNG